MTFQKGRKAYILMKDKEILYVFTSLKKLQEMMVKEDEGFASYSKLSKMSKASGVLEFSSKSDIRYTVHIKEVL